MKQEPVAWMSPDGKVSTTEGKLFYIPLYTAPRELSDEEIVEIYKSVKKDKDLTWEEWCKEEIDFARAILKKASEK